MPTFAVEYVYDHDSERRDAVRPRHRAFLAELLDQGHLLASGPFTDTDRPGALLIVSAPDAIAVAGLLDEDPFARESLIAERRITAWVQVFGPWAD